MKNSKDNDWQKRINRGSTHWKRDYRNGKVLNRFWLVMLRRRGFQEVGGSGKARRRLRCNLEDRRGIHSVYGRYCMPSQSIATRGRSSHCKGMPCTTLIPVSGIRLSDALSQVSPAWDHPYISSHVSSPWPNLDMKLIR